MYHASLPPSVVHGAAEEVALGPEWSRKYIYQPYPRAKYHWDGRQATVRDAKEETALGGGWGNSPSAFAPYKEISPQERTAAPNLTKWLESWPTLGLSSAQRNKFKAQALRADAVFAGSDDSGAGKVAAMRQAFDGFAGVLFDAGQLTEKLLQEGLPGLVWDLAIAAGWWRQASEERQDIFPDQVGHYWVYRDASRNWDELFRAESSQWEARLLETSRDESPADPDSVASPESSIELANGGIELTTVAQRREALADYTRRWDVSEGSLARAANVDRADLSKWKSGSLPAGSDKKARIEKALLTNAEPVLHKRSRKS